MWGCGWRWGLDDLLWVTVTCTGKGDGGGGGGGGGGGWGGVKLSLRSCSENLKRYSLALDRLI